MRFSVHRWLRKLVHQVLWLTSDSLIQFTSLIFLVVMMTTEGMRACMALTRQMALDSERLYVQTNVLLSPHILGNSTSKMPVNASLLMRWQPTKKNNATLNSTLSMGNPNLAVRKSQVNENKGNKTSHNPIKEKNLSVEKKPLVFSQLKGGNSSVIFESKQKSGLPLAQKEAREKDQKNPTEKHKKSRILTTEVLSDGENITEIQDSWRYFRGVNASSLQNAAKKADNITKLSFMVYRLVKAYNVSSILDAPCKASLPWIPQLVHRLEYEVPDFKYYCVLQSDKEFEAAMKKIGESNSVELLVRHAFWDFPLPIADLGFAWNALGYMAPEKSWGLLQTLQKLNYQYVALPNFPGVERNPGMAVSHGRVNVRRSPYLFGEPDRIMQDVGAEGQELKQLLLYSAKSLRKEV